MSMHQRMTRKSQPFRRGPGLTLQARACARATRALLVAVWVGGSAMVMPAAQATSTPLPAAVSALDGDAR